MSIECRAYCPDDLPRSVDLLRTGHDPQFDEARFRWLHEKSPGGPSRIVVCEDHDRLVGMSAVIPRPARFDGCDILAGRDVDPVVDPEFRGRGLFQAMLDWQLQHLEGIDLLYNFANPASARGFLRCGWRLAGRLRDQVCQLGYARNLSREHLLYLLTGLRFARNRTGGDVIELAPTDLDTLPRSSVPPRRRKFAVIRSLDYVKWRYAACPLHSYRYFVHGEKGRPLTLAVVRHFPERRRLIVMDVLAFEAEGGRLAPFLPTWRDVFGSCWTCVWSSVPEDWRRGFIANVRARNHGQPVFVREVPGSGDRALAALTAADLFVTHGDVEAN